MRKNFLVKLLIFLSLVSLILIIYRKHDISGIYNFNNNYFFVPLIFLGLSIIAIYLSKTVRFYLSYSLVAFLFSIYAIELIYFVTNNNNLEKKKYKYFKENNLDYRERLEIYDNILKNNLNETLTVSPQNFLEKNYSLFPLSGISKKKTTMCNESGYYNDYISDRFGFNNNDDIYERNNVHSVFIGDSFLHGACVKNEHNLISKLKSTPFFRGKNILNLGYEGNGPLLSLATLREYFPDSKNVKYLFWVYYEGNDLQELNSERMNKILIRYLNNLDYSQNLRIKQEEINNHVTKILNENKIIDGEINMLTISNIISILGLDRVRGLIFSKLHFKQYEKNIEMINLFEKIIGATKTYSNNFKTELIFIYIPSSFESEGKKYYNDVINILLKNEIKLIDLTNKKFIKNKKMYPQFGAHFNENGYNALSNQISAFMNKNY